MGNLLCGCPSYFYTYKQWIKTTDNNAFLAMSADLMGKMSEISVILVKKGANGDWDFRSSDLVKNPDGSYI